MTLAAWLLLLSMGLPCGGRSGTERRTELPPLDVQAALRARLDPRPHMFCSGGVEAATVWMADRSKATGRGSIPQPLVSAPRRYPELVPGELLGVMRLGTPAVDARGQGIGPGAYTLRYVVQPAFKEHLGTAVYSDFALLLPAALDDGASKDPQALIELSRASGELHHPLVLDLASTPASPEVRTPGPLGHMGLRLAAERPIEP